MFEHIFRIVIAKISILTLNRINATEPMIITVDILSEVYKSLILVILNSKNSVR